VIGYSNGNVNKEDWWSRGFVGTIFFLIHGHIDKVIQGEVQYYGRW